MCDCDSILGFGERQCLPLRDERRGRESGKKRERDRERERETHL
jgi:hypothetical protein